MRALFEPIAIAALVLNFVGSSAAEDLSEKGRKLSQAYCSRCHVVTDANKFGGISSTPSFRIIVNALKDWRERFETFHARLPHPSVIRVEGAAPASDTPPSIELVHLKVEDLPAFVAYAETLVKQ